MIIVSDLTKKQSADNIDGDQLWHVFVETQASFIPGNTLYTLAGLSTLQ